jgi:hypothetical protein
MCSSNFDCGAVPHLPFKINYPAHDCAIQHPQIPFQFLGFWLAAVLLIFVIYAFDYHTFVQSSTWSTQPRVAMHSQHVVLSFATGEKAVC